MLTLKQIVQRTTGPRKENARYVKILDVKKGYNSIGQGFIASSSYSTHIIDEKGRPIRHPNPQRYVTVITFLDRKLHVSVSCSCDDFLYRHEYALNSKGAADIEYSNGEPPTTTNPGLKTGQCKHLYKLYFSKLAGKIPGL